MSSRIPACVAALPLLLVAPTAAAQTSEAPRELDRVRVLGQRQPLARFPGAITVIDGQTLQDGQRQASLSEALQRAPGVLAMERHNYAQDLQVQSRGFGARSTFGIRGISLVSNDIPATALDGQGQAATFALGALDRIEVLRGPLALVHGNAAGGVIRAESVLEGGGAQTTGWRDSDGGTRLAARLDGGGHDDDAHQGLRWRLHGSAFDTPGHRRHSAATLRHAGLVARLPREGGHWQLVLDALQQPWTQDPLGLTRAQWQAEPQGTAAPALAFNTRKRVDNRQAGLSWSQAHAGQRHSQVTAWAARRDMQQFLAIPVAAQIPATSAGGVIELGRSSAGISASHRLPLAQGDLAVGVDLGRLLEHRRGYENFVGDALGVQGRLRRDERNRVASVEPWLAWERRLEHWTVLAAARHGRMQLRSSDRHGAALDSGPGDTRALRFGGTAAAVGLARALPRGEAFVSAGRGFESPTVTELAYRPDGLAGLNTALRPARYRSGEAGWRWSGASVRGDVTVFRIDGHGEIVPAVSSGGRASFANAGRTRRDGAELAVANHALHGWHWQLVLNATRARFTEAWSSHALRAGEPVTQVVAAGNRVPGIAPLHGFAELGWRSGRRPWGLALEAAGNSAITVNDVNSDRAPGHVRINAVARWRDASQAGWHGFLRIDNLLDRRIVGSVIVNEANGRHFEPAPGRTLTVGMGWRPSRD